MEEHFKNTKDWIFKNNYLGTKKKKNFLIEIGSNDGIFLKNFLKENTVKHLGFEPSKNVSDLARLKGVNSVNKFFNLKPNQYFRL